MSRLDSSTDSTAPRTQLADTQAVSIQAAPRDVFEFLADARNLPRWAPAFAQAVREEDDVWIVDTGEGELAIRVRAVRELGTVDYLAAAAPEGVELGAFARVVANGGGSELTFTQFLADGASDVEVRRQLDVVEGELRTVKTICERRGAD